MILYCIFARNIDWYAIKLISMCIVKRFAVLSKEKKFVPLKTIIQYPISYRTSKRKVVILQSIGIIVSKSKETRVIICTPTDILVDN